MAVLPTRRLDVPLRSGNEISRRRLPVSVRNHGQLAGAAQGHEPGLVEMITMLVLLLRGSRILRNRCRAAK